MSNEKVEVAVKGIEGATGAFARGLGDAMGMIYSQAIEEVSAKCGCLVPRMDSIESKINQFENKINVEMKKSDRALPVIEAASKQVVVAQNSVTELTKEFREFKQTIMKIVQDIESEIKFITEARQKAAEMLSAASQHLAQKQAESK
jgi:chromosome segregation ATPase